MIRLILIVFMLHSLAGVAEALGFGVARSLTPVLNTQDFPAVFGGKDGKNLKSDRCGQVRELEFIALPGTVFRVVKEIAVGKTKVLQVDTADYQAPSGISLYVDSRFIEQSDVEPLPRPRKLPEATDIISALQAAKGAPYVWGGNAINGVPELAESYLKESASATNSKHQILAGLDCSGLLYQATDGWTPRNTSQLVEFGRPVIIDGKTPAQLAALLQPLDLIVWNGHVIIVLDRKTTIESRLICGNKGNGGVVTTPLLLRLEEIMRTRRPVDAWPGDGKKKEVFVVRRWYEH